MSGEYLILRLDHGDGQRLQTWKRNLDSLAGRSRTDAVDEDVASNSRF